MATPTVRFELRLSVEEARLLERVSAHLQLSKNRAIVRGLQFLDPLTRNEPYSKALENRGSDGKTPARPMVPELVVEPPSALSASSREVRGYSKGEQAGRKK